MFLYTENSSKYVLAQPSRAHVTYISVNITVLIKRRRIWWTKKLNKLPK